jgi:NADH-quinone oxidoreductase subunit B
MGLEDHLPAGFLLTTVEKWAGYARSRSMWPGHVRPGALRVRVHAARSPRHDLARFGMEKMGARQADLMIVAGRVSQKMAPVMRQVYDQIHHTRLGANRDQEMIELAQAALRRQPLRHSRDV